MIVKTSDSYQEIRSCCQMLGSTENIGIKFKEGICAELCLKLWFEGDYYFCNITNGFESDSLERKSYAITF